LVGFVLVYAFFEEEGYAASEIPALILRHNLYGIDIDPRAVQLAELALVLKARERSRRFFQPELLVQPQVIALEDVRFDAGELPEYVRALDLGPLFDEPVTALLGQFEQATTFGSLIQPVLQAQAIAALVRSIEAKDVGGQLLLSATHHKVLRVLAQAAFLIERYHVVVANPPYMGKNQMNAALKQFAAVHLSAAKADTYAMFIERCRQLAKPNALVAMVTMQGWMFLPSFENLRAELSDSSGLVSMAHLGPRAFDTIGGEVVQTTCFVLVASRRTRGSATFIRVVDGRNEAEKERLLLDAVINKTPGVFFECDPERFRRVPGQPIAYWLSDDVVERFASLPPISDHADARSGMATGDNGRFLRLWHEVSWSCIGLGLADAVAARHSRRKWVPYNKGGGFRKWYGNNEYVVFWENDGEVIKRTKQENLLAGRITANNSKCWNQDRYFQRCITWSAIGTGRISVRWCEEGFIFDTKGQCVFADSRDRLAFFISLLNSSPAHLFLSVLSPTLDFNSGAVGRIPDCFGLLRDASAIVSTCDEAVRLARADWDSVETSWDFAGSPLVRSAAKQTLLVELWNEWERQCDTAVGRMRMLEERNNRALISAYGFEHEVSPDVSPDEVTLGRADQRRDSGALLSYAVGCMMGRYSLDKPGLILADAGDTLASYKDKVGRSQEVVRFAPDTDGIIPVLDGEWFEDDIVARTRDFLRANFGEVTIRENTRWLEESLGKDLRKYFVNDFYKDHLQTYKKRPIYWLVQSPRKGFSVLIYLHRYTRDTLNVVLNRYLREYEAKLRSRLAQLAQTLAMDALSARDRTAARKEQEKLTKVLHECEDWERQALLPLAQQRIELDLDDGVKVNYLKLADVLAPIPGLTATED
jgi:hypothetical protein